MMRSNFRTEAMFWSRSSRKASERRCCSCPSTFKNRYILSNGGRIVPARRHDSSFCGLRSCSESADPALRASIVRWAEKQPDMPTLSEATRRLVELGLTVKTKAKQPAAARARRANELAAKAIDKIIDPAAPPEERAQRRRRLIKGPSEFREDRIDPPKAKWKRRCHGL